MSSKRRDWSHDLSELQNTGKEILDHWRNDDPCSPRDFPSSRWLTNNGYAHLRWILKEKHDMGLEEFFLLLVSAGGDEEYEWAIDDIATIERIKAYLEDQSECRRWSSTTERTQRARINKLLGIFGSVFGDDSLLRIANDPDLEDEAYDAFKQSTKHLRGEYSNDFSVHQTLRSAHRFTEWLLRTGRIAYDPMEGIEEEFRFSWKRDPVPLSDKQVRRLWDAAATEEERIIILGYCIWGLRTRELPAIHIDQIVLDVDECYIDFNESQRKNGPGQVSIITGLEPLVRLVAKRKTQSDWNGYLFPSDDSSRSYMSPRQMRERFKTISRRAEVTIDDEIATPKAGRAFYYGILSQAEADLLKAAAEIAKDQGSADAATVRDFYLTEEERRYYRHMFFKQKICEILPDNSDTDGNHDINSQLDDFNEEQDSQ